MGFLIHGMLSKHNLDVSVSCVLCLFLSCSFCFGVESDINCLRSIKASLQDPLGYLNSSWDFNNRTEGFICKFLGVECWHATESKVLNIKLSDLGLKGEFPRGLENCTSLTGLDLSSNKLSGPLPDDINRILGFITSIDLSSNSFSGKIPTNLSNCSYLNTLKLDSNQFSGSIPPQLGSLSRLKSFSVANNQLSGPVPNFTDVTEVTVGNYANNPGLCGPPLDPCPGKKAFTKVLEAWKKAFTKVLEAWKKAFTQVLEALKSNSVAIAAAAGFGFAFPFSFCFFLPRAPGVRYLMVYVLGKV